MPTYTEAFYNDHYNYIIRVPDKRGSHIIFFLIFHENICYVYSLEVPHRGTSNEYPQHMFCEEMRKLMIWHFMFLPTLCKSYRDDGMVIMTLCNEGPYSHQLNIAS